MILRSLLLAGIACMLALSTACQNITNDLGEVTLDTVRQDMYVGMNKDAVIQKYGNYVYLKGKTVDNDEELYVYVFEGSDAPRAHNLFSFANTIIGLTRKNLLILFDHKNNVKDFKFDGLYLVWAFGFSSYEAYVHPLNEWQLADTKSLTMEEGQESYYRYLSEVKGIDRGLFTRQDLAGNRHAIKDYTFHVLLTAEEFAGSLKDIIVNGKPLTEEEEQLYRQ